jgi:hypothetical protein
MAVIRENFSVTNKLQIIFTLKIIVSIFVKLFNLSFTLATIFYRKNFGEKGYKCIIFLTLLKMEACLINFNKGKADEGCLKLYNILKWSATV